jgi:hypothetical protein
MRRICMRRICSLDAIRVAMFVALMALTPARAEPSTPAVPGVVIDYSPAASKSYIGSPSIVVLAHRRANLSIFDRLT